MRNSTKLGLSEREMADDYSLLRTSDEPERTGDDDDDDVDDAKPPPALDDVVVGVADAAPAARAVALACGAGVGALLFGFSLGFTSPALPAMEGDVFDDLDCGDDDDAPAVSSRCVHYHDDYYDYC